LTSRLRAVADCLTDRDEVLVVLLGPDDDLEPVGRHRLSLQHPQDQLQIVAQVVVSVVNDPRRFALGVRTHVLASFLLMSTPTLSTVT